MLLSTSSCYPAGLKRHQKAAIFTLLADNEDVEKEYRQKESLALPMGNMVMRRPLKVTKIEGKALKNR